MTFYFRQIAIKYQQLFSRTFRSLLILKITKFWLIDLRMILFGFDSTVLNWFISYLDGRTQSVKIKDILSTEADLQYGVPQGSVLGPLLYTLCIAPLGKLIMKFNLSYNLYADDSQLYLSVEPLYIHNLITWPKKLCFWTGIIFIGGYVSVCLSVCVCICLSIISKSSRPILMKLGRMMLYYKRLSKMGWISF